LDGAPRFDRFVEMVAANAPFLADLVGRQLPVQDSIAPRALRCASPASDPLLEQASCLSRESVSSMPQARAIRPPRILKK
jgi:hypothetical protein